MPFVHIELIKGRSDEQITNLMKDVTEAVHKNTGAPKEHIHVIINELGKHSYGQGGESVYVHWNSGEGVKWDFAK